MHAHTILQQFVAAQSDKERREAQVTYNGLVTHEQLPARIEMHPGTDTWMRGDRYGDVLRINRHGCLVVLLDKSKKRINVHPSNIGQVLEAVHADIP